MIPQASRLAGVVTLLLLQSTSYTLGSRIAMPHGAIAAYKRDIAMAIWTTFSHSVCDECRTMAAVASADNADMCKLES